MIQTLIFGGLLGSLAAGLAEQKVAPGMRRHLAWVIHAGVVAIIVGLALAFIRDG